MGRVVFTGVNDNGETRAHRIRTAHKSDRAGQAPAKARHKGHATIHRLPSLMSTSGRRQPKNTYVSEYQILHPS